MYVMRVLLNVVYLEHFGSINVQFNIERTLFRALPTRLTTSMHLGFHIL